MHPMSPLMDAPKPNIRIHADDHPGVINSITSVISDWPSKLCGIHAHLRDDRATIEFLVEVEVREGGSLGRIALELLHVPGVLRVESIQRA